MSSSIQYLFHPGFPTNGQSFLRRIIRLLGELRQICLQEKQSQKLSNGDDDSNPLSDVEFVLSSSLEDCLRRLCSALEGYGREREAETLQHVLELAQSDKELGGLGIGSRTQSSSWSLSAVEVEDVIFLVEAWLEALNSADKSRRLPDPVAVKDPVRRLMTLSEKIFAHHATHIPSPVGVKPGDFIRVSVDWVIASELSWVGMKHSLVSIGREPTVWRNDRFWLAGDHVVEPRTYEQPRVRKLIEGMAHAKKTFKMTENQGANYTILHTEFVRERAEPGMLVIGSDSHTCSGGALSCLAIGLGAADVMMTLATGETWFKVPESINIQFVNQPAWYINGKDTILYILKELKRNTVAADRVVEFSGPGARYLSCDSRFAISNMVTELGGITGVFAPDEVTHRYVSARPRKANRSSSLYFQADKGAQYAETFEIDLAKVESFIALYPSPDNVVPLAEKMGMKFDGCFIGACTTTEEELILAALVLQVGLRDGFSLAPGKRKVVPGSLPIVNKLKNLGLFDIYKDAGFDRPAPGCSLCLGMAADRAEAGEIWLSSQNRNFKNRMGKGSIGNICSAATVAASSFSMTLTDPQPFLAKVKAENYTSLLKSCQTWRRVAYTAEVLGSNPPLAYVEPYLAHRGYELETKTTQSSEDNSKMDMKTPGLRGRAYVLGDFVDTDAIIPADQILASPTDELLGNHCLQYTNPDFRHKVREGYDIIVAGKAFGCGSSREEAPRALKGLGVKCVIARSFSFIYGRNQPNIALLGIIINDDDFYAHASIGVDIEVIVGQRIVVVGGKYKYSFILDEMELRLIESRGLAKAFLKFGVKVFRSLCGEAGGRSGPEKWADRVEGIEQEGARAPLTW